MAERPFLPRIVNGEKALVRSTRDVALRVGGRGQSLLRSVRTRLLRLVGRDRSPAPRIPFEAEPYAAWPERFGDWHDPENSPPSPGPDALTEEQMRGELALIILRWLCWLAFAVAAVGLVAVGWRWGLA